MRILKIGIWALVAGLCGLAGFFFFEKWQKREKGDNETGKGEDDPAGIRRNNPFNLRATKDKWKGRIGEDSGFCVFDSVKHGARAYFITLLSYARSGVEDIRGMVYRYAPPSENHTENYLHFIVIEGDVRPDESLMEVLKDRDKAVFLAQAMWRFENGAWPSETQINEVKEGYEKFAEDRQI